MWEYSVDLYKISLHSNQSHLTEKNKESFRENNKLFLEGLELKTDFIDFFKSDDEFLEKFKIKCERKNI